MKYYELRCSLTCFTSQVRKEITDFKSPIFLFSIKNNLKNLQKAEAYLEWIYFVYILSGLLFSQENLHHRCSTGLYIGLWKYWNFQSEAKVEQIIAIVTMHSVSCWYFHSATTHVFILLSKVTFLLLPFKFHSVSWLSLVCTYSYLHHTIILPYLAVCF